MLQFEQRIIHRKFAARILPYTARLAYARLYVLHSRFFICQLLLDIFIRYDDIKRIINLPVVLLRITVQGVSGDFTQPCAEFAITIETINTFEGLEK